MIVVFLSHSSENVVEACGIRHWLRSKGFHDVVLSPSPVDGVGGASDWRKWIRRTIRKSDVVLPLISINWRESKHCADELELALLFSRKIVPIRLDKTPIEYLPDPIERRQICDISDMACEDEGYAKLLRALRQKPVKLPSATLAGLLVCVSLAVVAYRELPMGEDTTSCSDQNYRRVMRTHDVQEKLSCLESYLCNLNNTLYIDDAWPEFCNLRHAAKIEITMAGIEELIDRSPNLREVVIIVREDMISKVRRESPPVLRCGNDDVAFKKDRCAVSRTP